MSKAKRRTTEPTLNLAKTVRNTSEPVVNTKFFAWIGLVLLAVALIARVRLLDIPFERDEGAFAYIGRAFWGPERLYTDLYDNKLPGLYLIYSIFTGLFGAQPFGVHLGALLWQIATLAVFFGWLRELIGKDRALAVTGLYALYGASGEVLGFAAHATQLTALPAFAGLWSLWRGTIQARAPQALWILLAGLGAGLAIWVKQQAFFYALFGGIFLIMWYLRSENRVPVSKFIGLGALYAMGVLLPVGLSAAWFASQGRFDDFWFWTVTLSAGQAAQSLNGWFFFKFYFPLVAKHWWYLWLAGVAGCAWLLWQKEVFQQRALALLFPLSLLGTAIGGAFYPHYFVLALPWLACCAFLGLDALIKRYGTPGWAAMALVILWPLLAHGTYWFSDDFRTVIRRAYENDPFTEMAAIGKELKKRCAPADQIAVIGSEPEIFLYTDKPSAFGHLFFQGILLDSPRKNHFQDQVRKVWAERPRFAILPGAQYEYIKDDPLTQQLVADLQKDYHTVCVADITERNSKIIWDPSPENAVPKGLFWVMVMERNPQHDN